jgi:hypothetical protein
MPAIFDFLYREYCRARLTEMRKQLFLTQRNDAEAAVANGDPGSPEGADGLGDGDTRREAGDRRPS